MLSIVTIQASVAHAETQSFWTFFPNPPHTSPCHMDSLSVAIFVSNTWVLDGHPNGHLTPWWISFNYTRVAVGAPLCTGPQNITGCLKVHPINKTAMGGAKIANLSGPWGMYKYLQQLTPLGLATLSTIVPASHPPLPHCPNSSSVELLGFADWLECTHPLAVEHFTRLTQTIWD
ncbi:hypothetical protein mRhiFer1_009774 [Rhinolophus ferrumequinum]|uniref:Uncharacterized protein n=1 Tax=Rhinolophus ferrumequinum TaxID=59479 RepID=A0A7J7ZCQ0_RHIFE|nr:hypothetical protein mRhiFer1_009774 [Rhinolophus ferrumequinum]